MIVQDEKKDIFSDIKEVHQYSKCSNSLNQIFKHNSLTNLFRKIKKQKLLMEEVSRSIHNGICSQYEDHMPKKNDKEFNIQYFIDLKNQKEPIKPKTKLNTVHHVANERTLKNIQTIFKWKKMLEKDRAEIAKYSPNYNSISK